jgi:hypothetical protein
MDELYFTGMDIVTELEDTMEKLLSQTEITDDLDSTLRFEAYRYGVNATLNVLKQMLENEERLVVHVPGLEVPEEFDFDDVYNIAFFGD